MIIGLVGRARSGKTTAAGIIKKFIGDVEFISFAGPLKKFCCEVFDWAPEIYESELKELADPRHGVSPRVAAQTLGSWGRQLDAGCWLNLALRRATKFLSEPELIKVGAASHKFKKTRAVIIPDVRYRNEVEAIRAVNGVVIKLESERALKLNHASEQDIDDPENQHLYHYTIDNNGTIEQLEESIRVVFSDLGLADMGFDSTSAK